MRKFCTLLFGLVCCLSIALFAACGDKKEEELFDVTLSSGTGYTIEAEGQSGTAFSVKKDSELILTVTLEEEYQESVYTVKANGTALTETDGKFYYTVVSDTQITVEGVVADPVERYTVTLPTGEGYTLTADGQSGSSFSVDEGTQVIFRLALDAYYSESNAVVKANGTALTETDGAYSITVNEEISVTVEGIEKNTYTVTLPEETVGYSIAVNGNDSSFSAQAGTEIVLTVTLDERYDRSTVVVKANGEELQKTEDGYRFVLGADTQIAVTGVEINRYTVTLSTGEGYTLTADEQSGSSFSADEGAQVILRLALDTYYSESNAVVKANGTALTETDGAYSITVSEDVSVTVEDVERNIRTVTFPADTDGYTIETISGGTRVGEGTDVIFQVVLDEKYSQSGKTLVVRAGEAELQAIAGMELTYTFSVTQDTQITVEGVAKNRFEITFTSGIEGVENIVKTYEVDAEILADEIPLFEVTGYQHLDKDYTEEITVVTGDKTYYAVMYKEVATVQDFKAIFDSAETLGANYILTADLDFASETYTGADGKDGCGWVVPDEGDKTTVFTGVFDGGNYSIKNLHFDKYGTNRSLFGVLYGTVRNVSFTDVVVSGTGTLYGIAVIANVFGYHDGNDYIEALIENVSVSVTFTAAGDKAVDPDRSWWDKSGDGVVNASYINSAMVSDFVAGTVRNCTVDISTPNNDSYAEAIAAVGSVVTNAAASADVGLVDGVYDETASCKKYIENVTVNCFSDKIEIFLSRNNEGTPHITGCEKNIITYVSVMLDILESGNNANVSSVVPIAIADQSFTRGIEVTSTGYGIVTLSSLSLAPYKEIVFYVCKVSDDALWFEIKDASNGTAFAFSTNNGWHKISLKKEGDGWTLYVDEVAKNFVCVSNLNELKICMGAGTMTMQFSEIIGLEDDSYTGATWSVVLNSPLSSPDPTEDEGPFEYCTVYNATAGDAPLSDFDLEGYEYVEFWFKKNTENVWYQILYGTGSDKKTIKAASDTDWHKISLVKSGDSWVIYFDGTASAYTVTNLNGFRIYCDAGEYLFSEVYAI